jgi:hypothetical protein
MSLSSRSTATARAQKGTQSQAIGRSKGGMTIKILALTDALGNLVRFVLLPGPALRHGRRGAAERRSRLWRLQGVRQHHRDLNARGVKIVISQHPRRVSPLPIDTEMIYKWRHLIENFFCNLKDSNASPCAPTRPIRASPPSSISPPP